MLKKVFISLDEASDNTIPVEIKDFVKDNDFEFTSRAIGSDLIILVCDEVTLETDDHYEFDISGNQAIDVDEAIANKTNVVIYDTCYETYHKLVDKTYHNSRNTFGVKVCSDELDVFQLLTLSEQQRGYGNTPVARKLNQRPLTVDELENLMDTTFIEAKKSNSGFDSPSATSSFLSNDEEML